MEEKYDARLSRLERDMELRRLESLRHDEVHKVVVSDVGEIKADVKDIRAGISEIKMAAKGRERYEQGVKHGITGLWAMGAAVAAFAWAWIKRDS